MYPAPRWGRIHAYVLLLFVSWIRPPVLKYQYELLDELVEIIVDVVAIQRKSIRIGGADYPYELVKGKFLKLDSGHIRYVLDSMEKTTTHIANIKAYLLTALYNAPNTISNYYSAEVNYYEYGNGRNDV